MIAIASTIQCNLIPRMYCHRSTESPNELPSDASGDHQHDDENQCGRRNSGDQQVDVGAVVHVLVRRGGTAEVDIGALPGRALDRLVHGLLDRLDVADAFRSRRVAFMRDDQPDGVPVRRYELFETPREIRALERLWRKVERVVVLRFVEGIALRCGVVGLRSRLFVKTLCDRIVRHDGVEVALLALDLRGYQRYEFGLDLIQLVEIRAELLDVL